MWVWRRRVGWRRLQVKVRDRLTLHGHSPVATLPVNDTLASAAWAHSASPVLASPCTMFNAPGGAPAAVSSSAKYTHDMGAQGDGLYTNVLPHAKATATFHVHVCRVLERAE